MARGAIRRVGVTGTRGFIGTHLIARLKDDPGFRAVVCPRPAFEDPRLMASFVRECDAIVHLAGLSRHDDGAYLYRVNLDLTSALADAVASLPTDAAPTIFFGSTTHIAKQFPYHASKRDGQTLLEQLCPRVVTLLMANVFGPGSRPFYNSVVSTFCELAARGETPPRIAPDAVLRLVYVDDLCSRILNRMDSDEWPSRTVVTIDHTVELPLPRLWELLMSMKGQGDSFFPASPFESHLYDTFRSYPYSR